MKREVLRNRPGTANVAYFANTPPRPGQYENLLNEILFADPRRIFPGQPTVYNPSVLVSRQGMEIFDRMRRDDQVKAALYFKKYAALLTGWEIVSPKDEEDTWEVSQFIRDTLTNITDDERTLDDILLEVLTALDFGFSVSEKLFREDDGRLVIYDVKTRRPHSLEFQQDPYGKLLAIRQNDRQASQVQISIPQEKAILYVHQREFDNLYGQSDLEAAYRAWVVKDNSYRWLAMFLEKLGIPPIFILYNPSAYLGQPLNQLQTIIERLQSATFGMMPRREEKDLDFWSPQLAGQANSVFMPALEMFNRDIARAILVPSLVGATAESMQGSFARSQTHFDSFMMVVDRLRKSLASVVQSQLIRQLVNFNYGGVKESGYPQFRFLPIDDATRADLFNSWKDMVTFNIVTAQKSDEAHIRRILKMPNRKLGDEMPPPKNPLPFNVGPQGGGTGPGQVAHPAQQPGGREGEEAQKVVSDDEEDAAARRTFEQLLTADYAAIGKRLDSLEARAAETLSADIVAIRDALVDKVMKGEIGQSFGSIKSLKLPAMTSLQTSIKAMLLSAYGTGERDLRTEIAPSSAKQYADPLYTPVQAMRWLDQKALWVTGVFDDQLVNSSQQILLNAIKTGESPVVTAQKLADLFMPYINEAVEAEVVTPNRLGTIVRTNTTEAYNIGRITAAQDPDLEGLIEGMLYSAILDSRTTEVCQRLDGVVIPMDHPMLNRLAPPNHYNCRSLLVAIPLGVDPATLGYTMITDEDIEFATDWAQEHGQQSFFTHAEGCKCYGGGDEGQQFEGTQPEGGTDE
mgnify:FL=1